MLSKPHFCQLSGLKGTHLHQFEAHLGTKLITFPINQEKCQLRFRSRGDMKIKLFRVCISRFFMIFWCVLSKPVIAALDRRHNSHYPQFVDPLGIPFATQICNILHFIFHVIFSPNIFWQVKSRSGICDTTGVRGELGGIWDSRRPWGSRRLRITKIDASLS